MRRQAIIICIGVVGLLMAAIVGLPRIGFFMHTGRFFPVHKLETLNRPVAVKGWTSEGLQLSDR